MVWINLREAIADKAISTPTQMAEMVFQFAKEANAHPQQKPSQDPIWGFSDGIGRSRCTCRRPVQSWAAAGERGRYGASGALAALQDRLAY